MDITKMVVPENNTAAEGVDGNADKNTDSNADKNTDKNTDSNADKNTDKNTDIIDEHPTEGLNQPDAKPMYVCEACQKQYKNKKSFEKHGNVCKKKKRFEIENDGEVENEKTCSKPEELDVVKFLCDELIWMRKAIQNLRKDVTELRLLNLLNNLDSDAIRRFAENARENGGRSESESESDTKS
jgi:hypothetical protein